jgi:raffinose/stachyose/melibiose transport system substrate-binding protein
MKRRIFLTTAAAAAAVTLISGCGSTAAAPLAADALASPDYAATLSVLTKFGGDPLQPYFENLAKGYQKLHPQVKIQLIQESDQSIKDKTKTLTASGALPDVYFSWTGNWAENFVSGGLAADLSSVIGPDTAWGKSFGAASVDAFKFDGKYFGIPLYNDAKFMGYNKALFSKLGLSVPTTFDELLGACGKIKSAGYEPIAFGNKDGWPALHYVQQLLAYNVPASVLQGDYNPAAAKLDDPGYAKALSQFKELVDQCTGSGAQSNGVLYSTAQQSLASGHAAMYYQEILEFDNVNAPANQINKDGFGFFQLPAPAGAMGDPNALEGAPEGYLINAKSKNVALAVDFMKFVTDKESAPTLAATPYGQPSTVVGAVNGSNSSASVVAGVELINKADALVPWLDTANVPDVGGTWLSATEGLVTGSLSPSQVMDQIRTASQGAK